jgi:hypothetical protein
VFLCRGRFTILWGCAISLYNAGGNGTPGVNLRRRRGQRDRFPHQIHQRGQFIVSDLIGFKDKASFARLLVVVVQLKVNGAVDVTPKCG